MIRTNKEISIMRESGHILAQILHTLVSEAVPGAKPSSLDALARAEAKKMNAVPAFLGYNGYPAAVCISRNAEVVHGIPGDTPLKDGDVVGFDFGIRYRGWYTDAARTVCVGICDEAKKKLIVACKEAFFRGAQMLKDGVHIGDVSHAIQSYVEAQGFSVIRALVGHAVGKQLHEDPRVPNFGTAGTGPVIHAGMTLAIEPMIAMGSYEVVTAADGWTISTNDKSISSHYEETVLVTKTGYDILTK